MATKNTRRAALSVQNQNQVAELKGTKRAHEISPSHKPAKRTRTAFGDITNKENAVGDGKRGGKKTGAVRAGKKKTTTVVVPRPPREAKQGLTSSQQERDVSWDVIELSQESNSSNSQASSKGELDVDTLNDLNIQLSQDVQSQQQARLDWENIDAEHMMDPFQVALYAADIFEYYKRREAKFVIDDYMTWQDDLNVGMRAILVDWLVEVQENFELNHETLYLAVKLVDHYLCRETTKKNKLQLVGATAMFIAGKFDERFPPVLDDYLYVCDDAYTRKQLIEMEMLLLKTVDFDLGIPLSYRYLRRFAKCGRADIETLTLGRYMLEMSLMDYNLCRTSDCKLAAAALLLANSMKGDASWSETLQHYTSHSRSDLCPVVVRLNKMIAASPSKNLATIRTKYSHKVFHEVAKVAPLTEEQLSALSFTD